MNLCVVHSQGNVPVGKVETSPEISLLYKGHLLLIANTVSAADALSKDVKKKLFKAVTNNSNSRHRACA
jgi:hypothetical protein